MSFFDPGETRVKICGITNPTDAAMAVKAGADAIGLNFFAGSKRFLSFPDNRDWIADLAGTVDRIAVVVNAGADEIAALRDSGCFEAIQFHGDETPLDCSAAGFSRWLRAVRVRGRDSLADLADYRTPFLLIDAWSPGAYGGTGERLDWDLAREIVLEHPAHRVILAGGLTPSNVRDAVRIARPHGVDVAGGVEIGPRRKDEYLVREFIRTAKHA